MSTRTELEIVDQYGDTCKFYITNENFYIEDVTGVKLDMEFSLEQLSEIIPALQQMEATLKRRAAK